MWRRRSQDGRGVGRGEHFLPHKLIKRAFKRRVNSTKQLLNASRGHQAPRKATQLFERRGKKIKDKIRDKRGRDGAPSREGSLKKREVSKHQETFSLPNVPSFGSTEGNITGRKKNKQLKLAHCEPEGNSPSGEAEQTPAHAIRKQGLGREARCGLHRSE